MNVELLNEVDLLDEDKPIAQQKYVCLSFISPENIIKKKEEFYLESFLKKYDLNKSLTKFTQFINYISFKYSINIEELNTEFESFTKSEQFKLSDEFKDDYKTFIDNNEEELDNEFSKQNNFQTSVRGIKVRGVFPTQEEAESRCKIIRQFDTNHDVYVGPVGLWVPFHPESYKTGRVEYLEKELNDLMHEKYKNESKVKEEFEKRTKESKLNAIQKNLENAKIHGSKLTQTINDKGELVNIENINETDKFLGVNADLDEIKEKMFQDNNIKTNSEKKLEPLSEDNVEPVLEQVE